MPLVSRSSHEHGRFWYWPPYGFTKIAVAFATLVAIFVNLPAVEVPHAGLHDGKYGPHFECVADYEHGWPLRYSQREPAIPVVPQPARPPYWIERSAWLPWDGPKYFDLNALIIDLIVAIGTVVCVALAAQWWRSRRRAIWQVRILDFLGLLAAIGFFCAWVGQPRLRQLSEDRMIEARARDREREGISISPFSTSHYIERDVAVPAWLPKSIRERYRAHFGQVIEFHADGDARIATRFHSLLVLDRPEPNAHLADTLRRLPQLEAIDWCKGGTYDPATQHHGGLERLPSMPRLRGINLYETDADDADVAWLAKCPNLERICLFDTEVTDAGMRHLTSLKRLRILEVDARGLTNRACETIAQITSLEELYLGGREITDDGVLALSALQKLQQLRLDTSASPAAISELKRRMPKCSISGS